MTTRVTIYTDGACKGNPGPGGWGVYLIYGEHVKKLHGGQASTTNNRMELQAAIEGLQALKRPCAVDLFTDSQYVRKGITEWIGSWQKNNWLNSSKKPVKNADLWKRLLDEETRHDVKWHWVKGHSGDEGNEVADELANLGVAEVVKK